MIPVIVALGSNVGDSLRIMQDSIERMSDFIRIHKLSRPVRSAPMYVEDQPPFVNAALVGDTELGPLALIRALKKVEADLGRLPRVRNGPREIDLDVIGYGSLVLRSERIEVPHPRVVERRFVLQPLAEIAPQALLPGLGFADALLAQTEGQANSVHTIEDAAFQLPGAG